MKMTLHHINFVTTDVAKLNDFYRNVMGLADEPTLNANRITNQGYAGKTAFATNGHVQIHLAERDLALRFAKSSSSIRWIADTLPFAPTTSLPSRSASKRTAYRTRTMVHLP